jgi:predicted dehydrogenase
MEEMLRDPSIAAVAIATPIPLLAGFAQAALQAGKHVFVEKPLAETAAQAGPLPRRLQRAVSF